MDISVPADSKVVPVKVIEKIIFLAFFYALSAMLQLALTQFSSLSIITFPSPLPDLVRPVKGDGKVMIDKDENCVSASWSIALYTKEVDGTLRVDWLHRTLQKSALLGSDHILRKVSVGGLKSRVDKIFVCFRNQKIKIPLRSIIYFVQV